MLCGPDTLKAFWSICYICWNVQFLYSETVQIYSRADWKKTKTKKQGDRDDAQEITAFWKYIIFNMKSLSNKYF